MAHTRRGFIRDRLRRRWAHRRLAGHAKAPVPVRAPEEVPGSDPLIDWLFYLAVVGAAMTVVLIAIASFFAWITSR